MAFITNKLLRKYLEQRGIDPDAPGMAEQLAEQGWPIGRQPNEGFGGDVAAFMTGVGRGLANTAIGAVDLPLAIGRLAGVTEARLDPLPPSFTEMANPVASGLGQFAGVVPTFFLGGAALGRIPALARMEALGTLAGYGGRMSRLRALSTGELTALAGKVGARMPPPGGILSAFQPAAVGARAVQTGLTMGALGAIQPGDVEDRFVAAMHGLGAGAVFGALGAPRGLPRGQTILREALAGAAGPPPVDIPNIPGPVGGALFGGLVGAMVGGRPARKEGPVDVITQIPKTPSDAVDGTVKGVARVYAEALRKLPEEERVEILRKLEEAEAQGGDPLAALREMIEAREEAEPGDPVRSKMYDMLTDDPEQVRLVELAERLGVRQRIRELVLEGLSDKDIAARVSKETEFPDDVTIISVVRAVRTGGRRVAERLAPRPGELTEAVLDAVPEARAEPEGPPRPEPEARAREEAVLRQGEASLLLPDEVVRLELEQRADRPQEPAGATETAAEGPFRPLTPEERAARQEALQAAREAQAERLDEVAAGVRPPEDPAEAAAEPPGTQQKTHVIDEDGNLHHRPADEEVSNPAPEIVARLESKLDAYAEKMSRQLGIDKYTLIELIRRSANWQRLMERARAGESVSFQAGYYREQLYAAYLGRKVTSRDRKVLDALLKAKELIETQTGERVDPETLVDYIFNGVPRPDGTREPLTKLARDIRSKDVAEPGRRVPILFDDAPPQERWLRWARILDESVTRREVGGEGAERVAEHAAATESMLRQEADVSIEMDAVVRRLLNAGIKLDTVDDVDALLKRLVDAGSLDESDVPVIRQRILQTIGAGDEQPGLPPVTARPTEEPPATALEPEQAVEVPPRADEQAEPVGPSDVGAPVDGRAELLYADTARHSTRSTKRIAEISEVIVKRFGDDHPIAKASVYAKYKGTTLTAIDEAARLRAADVPRREAIEALIAGGYLRSEAFGAVNLVYRRAKWITVKEIADIPEFIRQRMLPEISRKLERAEAGTKSSERKFVPRKAVEADPAKAKAEVAKERKAADQQRAAEQRKARQAAKVIEGRIADMANKARRLTNSALNELTVKHLRKRYLPNRAEEFSARLGQKAESARQKLDEAAELRARILREKAKLDELKQTIDERYRRRLAELDYKLVEAEERLQAAQERPFTKQVVSKQLREEALAAMGKPSISKGLFNALPLEMAFRHTVLRLVDPAVERNTWRMLRTLQRLMDHPAMRDRAGEHFPVSREVARSRSPSHSMTALDIIVEALHSDGADTRPKLHAEKLYIGADRMHTVIHVYDRTTNTSYYFNRPEQAALFIDLLNLDVARSEEFAPPGTPGNLGDGGSMGPFDGPNKPKIVDEDHPAADGERGGTIPPPATPITLGFFMRKIVPPKHVIEYIDRQLFKATGKNFGLTRAFATLLTRADIYRNKFAKAKEELEDLYRKYGIGWKRKQNFRLARAMRLIDAQLGTIYYEAKKAGSDDPFGEAMSFMGEIRAKVFEDMGLADNERAFIRDAQDLLARQFTEMGISQEQMPGYWMRMQRISRAVRSPKEVTDPLMQEFIFSADKERVRAEPRPDSETVDEVRQRLFAELGMVEQDHFGYAMLHYMSIGYRYRYLSDPLTEFQGLIKRLVPDLDPSAPSDLQGAALGSTALDVLRMTVSRFKGEPLEGRRAEVEKAVSRRIKNIKRALRGLDALERAFGPAVPKPVTRGIREFLREMGVQAIEGDIQLMLDGWIRAHRSAVFGVHVMRTVRDFVTTTFLFAYPRFNTADFARAFYETMLNWRESKKLVTRFTAEGTISAEALPDLGVKGRTPFETLNAISTGIEWMSYLYRRADFFSRVLVTRASELAVERAWKSYKYTRNFDDFIATTGLDTYSEPVTAAVRAELESAIKRGDMSTVKAIVAREHQTGIVFNFLRPNAPPFYESVVGRLAGQYGSWPINAAYSLTNLVRGPYQNYMRRPDPNRARFARRQAVIASKYLLAAEGVYSLGALFGIDTSDWIPFLHNIWYTGGPAVTIARDLREILGGDPVVARRLEREPGQVLGTLARRVIPLPGEDMARRIISQMVDTRGLFPRDLRRAMGLPRLQNELHDQVAVSLGFMPFSRGLTRYRSGPVKGLITGAPQLVQDGLHNAFGLPPGSEKLARRWRSPLYRRREE